MKLTREEMATMIGTAVVYLLKTGQIEVGQGKKKLFQLSPGETLGLNEFYQKCPSLFWAQEGSGSSQHGA